MKLLDVPGMKEREEQERRSRAAELIGQRHRDQQSQGIPPKPLMQQTDYKQLRFSKRVTEPAPRVSCCSHDNSRGVHPPWRL
ncbi:hypothetical protein RRG08_032064 [Elysia crispata]|uniref:Uncharacterized protein n=1 Tax=Elysia crispata TaxID=231223 RepID=A0AAE0ZGL2_9GAST|nr:hypothetical protein RRG08_032064 [Elysia crispata]